MAPVILFETQVATFPSFALQPERLSVAKKRIIIRVTTLKAHLVEFSLANWSKLSSGCPKAMEDENRERERESES